MAVKKVFVLPAPTRMHRAVAGVLEEAGDVEVVYGLPEADRWRRPDGEADAERLRGHAESVLEAALPELHGIYAGGPRRIDRALIERAPRLEVVFLQGAGFDAIDLAAATEHGVACVNSSGVNAAPVSDGAVGLMLAASMRIAYTDRYMHRERRWLTLADLDARDMHPVQISGATLGVVGFGFIGREVARKCRDGFGMRVLAYDPHFDPAEAERLGVTLVDRLDEMLPECDFVSVNCPLTAETRAIIGERELGSMKPSAFLVNTSRGGTVDGEALLRALRSGSIAGAGLDVTDPEPLPDGHPLYALDNVVLSPHVTGGAGDTMAKLGEASATQALRVLRGERSFRVLNPEVWPALRARRRRAG